MADYYPLLARALDALPDRSPALRKAVYDRARSALIAQLRSLDPPISEADIDLERSALDNAIARLETEYGAPAPPVSPGAGSGAAPRAPEAERASAAVPAAKVSSEPAPASPPSAAVQEPRPRVDAMPPAVPLDLTPAADTQRRNLPEAGPPPDVPIAAPARRPRSETPSVAKGDPASGASNGSAVVSLAPEPAADAPEGARRPRIAVVPPRAGRSRLLRNGVVGVLLAIVIGSIAVAAFLLRDRPVDLPAGLPDARNGGPEPETKFADRVGGERADPERRAPLPGAGAADLTVAQRAVLYEENPNDPKAAPTAIQGRAVWRLESVSGEQGQPLQNAARANVDYPDAGFSLAMTIRRNLDATLPASHIVELAFTSTGPSERVVQDVGLLQLKEQENARGSPVSGLPVRVRDNLFLIGLSNLPNDVERNTELLMHKDWFDLAIKLKSGPRAVLAFDKGSAGAQVMQAAFDAWREQ